MDSFPEKQVANTQSDFQTIGGCLENSKLTQSDMFSSNLDTKVPSTSSLIESPREFGQISSSFLEPQREA